VSGRCGRQRRHRVEIAKARGAATSQTNPGHGVRARVGCAPHLRIVDVVANGIVARNPKCSHSISCRHFVGSATAYPRAHPRVSVRLAATPGIGRRLCAHRRRGGRYRPIPLVTPRRAGRRHSATRCRILGIIVELSIRSTYQSVIDRAAANSLVCLMHTDCSVDRTGRRYGRTERLRGSRA
jgi:hypothetical protein